ncbi:FAD:protein FMN transferase [Calditrichota bacterium]
MGTIYNVKIIHHEIDETLLADIQKSVENSLKRVNQQMSTYISDSEVSRFNASKDTNRFQISKELYTVIQEAIRVNNLSAGAFDITVNPLVVLWGFGNKDSKLRPPRDSEIRKVLRKIGTQHLTLIDSTYIKKEIPDLEIDLSAIAKGYGVDVVADVLHNFNFENYMVEIGGEVFTKGKNIKNDKWKIGIDKPKYLALPGQKLQSIINISNVGVATSGDYRNFYEVDGKIYSHTINPKTGKPVTHRLASVTIVAPNCMQADALATAALVMGAEKGIELIESMENVEGYFISRIKLDEFEETSTSGFKKYIN